MLFKFAVSARCLRWTTGQEVIHMLFMQRTSIGTRRTGTVVVGMMLAALCVVYPFQGSASAQDDLLNATILIDGVPGLRRDGSIPILSFHAGITRSTSSSSLGSGGSAQRPEFSGVTITKVFDETTPRLNLMAALGTHISSVEISFYNETQQRYFVIVLEDVLITSIQTKEHVVGTRPVEAITFLFNRIVWTALPGGKGDNPIVGGWNIPSGSAL
jgi:type VI secretion system Hcp family effector